MLYIALCLHIFEICSFEQLECA
uniref:Uncharacterized protein n=1 Tax=Arundo donax TaxID=35708 RepID=A0A0A9CAM6_ARUDO